jgi:hypothetical protein
MATVGQQRNLGIDYCNSANRPIPVIKDEPTKAKSGQKQFFAGISLAHLHDAKIPPNSTINRSLRPDVLLIFIRD